MLQADPRVDNPLERSRPWIGVVLALSCLLYLAYTLWLGFSATAEALSTFHWPLYALILLTTLVNYALRYVKWAYLLDRVQVRVPHRANIGIFIAGLAMTITPGKTGELVKPWLIHSVNGAPMVRTIPVLIAERTADALALVGLAAIGVSTYYAEGIGLVLTTAAILVSGLVVLAIEPLSLAILRTLRFVPLVGRFVDKLEAMYRALRQCLSPVALVWIVLLSALAWFAECTGCWLVFKGLQLDAGLDLATFIYSFATVFGAPSPGGVGMADAALVEGVLTLIHGTTGGQAMAAALLVRVATLWFGVFLGALVLLRVDVLVRSGRAEAEAQGSVVE